MKRRRIDVNLGELDQLLNRAVQAPLSEPDCHKIKTTLHTLVEMLAAKGSTEKSSAVVGASGGEAALTERAGAAENKANGHGRNPASAYIGATKVAAPHPSLQPGAACPECPKGKVYAQKEARPLVRIVGQAPLAATVYNLEELRCNEVRRLLAGQTETSGEDMTDSETRQRLAAVVQKHARFRPKIRIPLMAERSQYHGGLRP